MIRTSKRDSAAKRHWMKDPFCGFSHLVGAGLSIVGLVALLVLANGRPWHVIGFAIYGATLVTLYTASALYHSLQVGERVTAWLNRFDYIAIFLLIAGTYTPVCLIVLRGPWGWGMLIAEYVMAAFGIFTTIYWKARPHWVRVVLYLGMGWLAIIALGPLSRVLPGAALGWLLAGGLTYSLGTVVYALDRPHLWPGRFTAHDLWHLFVLGGSLCHYILMLLWVAPAA